MAIIPRRPPLVNPNQRQLDARRYQESVNRMKGMQQGSDLYNKNLNTVQTLGKQHGWNYQQYGAPQNNTTPNPGNGTTPNNVGATVGNQMTTGTNPTPGVTPTNQTNTAATGAANAAVGNAAASPWMSLDRNNAMTKYREADQRIKSGRFQPGTPEYDKNMKILTELGGKFGWKYQDTVGNWKPTPAPAPGGNTTPPAGNNNQPPAPQPQTPAAPATPAPADTNASSPMTQALLQALTGGMSSIRAYEPQNFEGSPMYQFQKQKGMQDLERLMAARGLTNSGAEIQANSDFLAQLNASEAEKQRQYAQGDMDRTMGGLFNVAGLDRADRQMNWEQNNANLNRLLELQQLESNRNDQARGRDQNFLLGLLGIQAQNPIADQSFKATGEASQYQKALQDALAAFTSNNYQRQIPSGGGGAGLPPPAPQSNSGLDIGKLLLAYGNRADNQGLWGTLFGSLAR